MNKKMGPPPVLQPKTIPAEAMAKEAAMSPSLKLPATLENDGAGSTTGKVAWLGLRRGIFQEQEKRKKRKKKKEKEKRKGKGKKRKRRC